MSAVLSSVYEFCMDLYHTHVYSKPSQYIGASESRGRVYYTTSRQPMDIASAVEDTQGDVILFHIYAS